MFNAKYKKGMADAAKAYQGFGQKQEDALNHILEEVRLGKKSIVEAVSALNGNLDGLYDHLKSKEKASLYTVYTPFDIKGLGNQERLFLLGALLRFTVDKTPNENQQNYIRAVQKYLEVKEPPFGVDLMAIENIEDVPSQKAILQTVLEYLRLQEGDGYDETELQQEFLDAFSVSNRVKNEIINHVELLYGANGAQGLAEKYGYVPEEEPEEVESAQEVVPSKTTANNVEISEELADKIAKFLYGSNDSTRLVGENTGVDAEYLIETADYIVFKQHKHWSSSPENGLYTFDKTTGDKKQLLLESDLKGLPELPDLTWINRSCCEVVDYACNSFSILNGTKCYFIDIAKKSCVLVYSGVNDGFSPIPIHVINKEYILLQTKEGCQLIQLETGTKKLIDQSRAESRGIFVGNDLYLAVGNKIFRYDISSRSKEKLFVLSAPVTYLQATDNNNLIALCSRYFGSNYYGSDFAIYYIDPDSGDDSSCEKIGPFGQYLRGDEPPHYSCFVDGIVFTLKSDSANSRFDVKYFDFQSKEMIQLACTKEDDSIPEWELKLGNYVYFVKGSEHGKKTVRMKVSIANPEDVEII